MSAICDLPTVPLVVSTLSGLLGRQITVSKADVTEHSAPHLVVEYHMNPGDHLGAAFVIDLEFAALLGGALALIPAGGVKEMVAENDIGEGCLDAMREVLNVCACIFVSTADGSPSRLISIFEPGDAIPDEMTSLMNSAPHRIDYTVEVEGYGSGVLSMMTR